MAAAEGAALHLHPLVGKVVRRQSGDAPIIKYGQSLAACRPCRAGRPVGEDQQHLGWTLFVRPAASQAKVVSAVSYAATGNWKEAAWAAGGALAATVGMGAAVKGARMAVGAVKAAKAAKAAKIVGKCKNSFAPETLVLMANGSYKPISQVRAGDYVVAVDPSTGTATTQPVLEEIVGQGTKHIINIDLDGDLSDTLVVTADHPIWVLDRGWVLAKDVVAGDSIVFADKQPVAVQQVIDRGWIADQLVYNLNVGNVHTYVVQVDGYDVLAHNSSCGVHGNSLKCTCTHYVYKITKNGKLYKYGEGKGDRLSKQVAKLNRQGNGTYRGHVLRGGLPGKQAAKAVETRLIRGFFNVTGRRPSGNRSWH